MLGGARLFYKKVDSLPKVLILRPNIRHCSVTSQAERSVVIPPRVERSPTDILKALSSTVGVDYTAYAYKYPDDPYFYPNSEEEKQIYALSLESGRKSARWIFKNNPGFFKHQLSEPPIQEYFVKPTVEAETEPTEEALLREIEERNVLKAIEIYKVLEKRNIDVSDSAKQCLLELTCFYNCEERPNKDLEEKWFLSNTPEEEKIKIWMHKGFAQKLFEKMDSTCSLANSTIIQGMLKYDEIALAHEIFQAAKVKKVRLSVGVYNMILSKMFEESSGREIIKRIQDTLVDMSQKKIQPNVGTLNAVLQLFLQSKDFKENINFALKVMAEFERLGIEPSLGTYGYLLRIITHFPTERRKYFGLVSLIMAQIENKKFEILHPADLKFFTNAAVVFSQVYFDPDLSLRLLEMYFRNNNSKFIVSNTDEVDFLKNVFFIIFAKKPIELTIDVYRRFFFTIFNPNLRILRLVFSAIGESHRPELLAEVWEDIKHRPFKKNRVFLGEILRLIKIFSDESSLKIFHSAALSYFSLIESNQYFCEDPSAFSIILIAFVKNDDEKNVLNLLNNFKKHSILSLNQEAIEELFSYGLSKQKIPLLLESLKIGAQMELPTVNKMASKALPFLEGDSKAWAVELLNKETEKVKVKGKEKKKKK